MKKLIEIISRNGISAGPGHKTVLHLPVTDETSKVFNTQFRSDDSVCIETDGHTVTVVLVNDNGALLESIDRKIATRLLDYFFFGGITSAVSLTKSLS